MSFSTGSFGALGRIRRRRGRPAALQLFLIATTDRRVHLGRGLAQPGVQRRDPLLQNLNLLVGCPAEVAVAPGAASALVGQLVREEQPARPPPSCAASSARRWRLLRFLVRPRRAETKRVVVGDEERVGAQDGVGRRGVALVLAPALHARGYAVGEGGRLALADVVVIFSPDPPSSRRRPAPARSCRRACAGTCPRGRRSPPCGARAIGTATRRRGGTASSPDPARGKLRRPAGSFASSSWRRCVAAAARALPSAPLAAAAPVPPPDLASADLASSPDLAATGPSATGAPGLPPRHLREPSRCPRPRGSRPPSDVLSAARLREGAPSLHALLGAAAQGVAFALTSFVAAAVPISRPRRSRARTDNSRAEKRPCRRLGAWKTSRGDPRARGRSARGFACAPQSPRPSACSRARSVTRRGGGFGALVVARPSPDLATTHDQP